MTSQIDIALFRCPRCTGVLKSDSEFLACRDCGHQYPAIDGIPVLVRDWPQHQKEIEEAQRVLPNWYEVEQPPEDVSPWRHHIRKRRLYVTNVIERYLERHGATRAQRLLDLGCGDGTHLAWLAPFAERIYGSDYNMIRLARARHRAPDATLFLADILDYPCVDNYFDIIFFNHVIEHIPDDVAALRTIERILRPGGLLVLGTPNEGCWWWQLAYKRAPDVLAISDHVHFYTADMLTERMGQAGLLVSEVEHMGWGPPDWRLDGRIRKYKLVDDAFELFGRALFPRQASSLYVLAGKGMQPSELDGSNLAHPGKTARGPVPSRKCKPDGLHGQNPDRRTLA